MLDRLRTVGSVLDRPRLDTDVMHTTTTEQLIVSASGIRGVLGSGLTPEVAARYGAAFGTYLSRGGGRGRALVGRDSRTSGPLLLAAVASGLRASGLDVLDLGIVPTPTGLLAAGDDEDALGVVLVTASHNPVEWNGLKLGGADGRFVTREAGVEVQRIYESAPAYSGWDELGDLDVLDGAIDHHIDRILALPSIDPAAIAEREFTVALDCVRGAGGRIMPALLERLGCQVAGLHLEPDGHFPRNPEPAAANLEELEALVGESRAVIGMAVDPDVDRLSLVDELGRAIGEDWTLALAVEQVLSGSVGPVVTNLSTSRCVGDAAQRHGQPFHFAPVGEANVARRMEELEAVVGGEGNGGVMLPALHATRDAPLAAALILQLLADRGTPLSELLLERDRYHMAKAKAPRAGLDPEAIYERILDAAGDADADRQDGLRIDWPDGRWLHVRPSGTEPILRIIAEASEAAEASRLADWVGELLSEDG